MRAYPQTVTVVEATRREMFQLYASLNDALRMRYHSRFADAISADPFPNKLVFEPAEWAEIVRGAKEWGMDSFEVAIPGEDVPNEQG